MKSYEFMQRLNSALSSLPKEERESALSYYEEYFADAADEDRAVVKLGSPETVAENILNDYRDTQVGGTKTAAPPSNNNSGLNTALLIIVLVLLSPVWLPVLLGVICTVFALFISVAAILVSLAITGFALLIAGVCMILVGIAAFIRLTVADGMLLLGAGMIMAAVGTVIAVVMTWVTVKATPLLLNWFVDICKMPFNKLGGRKA